MNLNLLEWLEFILGKLKKEERNLFWIICWWIWHARNKLCFEDRIIDWNTVLMMASRMLNDYSEANNKANKLKQKIKKWSRPEKGFIKMNSDAGLCGDRKWGLGFVIRDDLGVVLRSGNKALGFGGDIDCAEGEAILFGLRNASECGAVKVIVESDCLQVIMAVKNGHQGISEIAGIIRDILEEGKKFQSVQWIHIPRKANSVAHKLAAIAISNEENIWVGSVPEEAKEICRKDMEESGFAMSD